MGWWKADPIPNEEAPPLRPTAVAPSPRPAEEPSACPVDSATRQIWLQQAKSKAQQTSLPSRHPPLPPSPRAASSSFAAAPSEECSSDRIDQTSSPPPRSTSPQTTRPLSHDRVISTIPRGFPSSGPAVELALANSEAPAAHHPSGNWIYPSESQFFEAVMRKQTASPESVAHSVSSIIPIHNAVNERAWSLIKAWEKDSSKSCGGPKLRSFKGLGAGALSPKAQFNSLLGYTTPFDRHDWVVERCGGDTVEYVIDFYQGKEEGGRPGSLNFYLDVRPKLNSIEGWKMRAERMLGTR